jgi:periplasmic divalent cation tolerance protein
MASNFIIIHTTYPQKQQAVELSQLLLNRKLAACIQINEVESAYLYNNNICSEQEFVVAIKTTKNLFDTVAAIIASNHPYKVPQIIATNIEAISDDYANWFINAIKT